ncbi:MAG: zinc ribbon domain-containing protein [Thiohalocapsa sp.]|nr:zinc ribbon domain-containing protein [Thiohalocapsa sp.]
MPLYDYRCTECGSLFETSHPMGAAAPGCPACGALATKAFLAAPAVHGNMARGREEAVRTLDVDRSTSTHVHGPNCGCSRH